MKYTKGPWKAHKTGLSRSGLPEYEIHWSNIGECVAEIVHGEADAILIAAAPDLLKACIAYRNAVTFEDTIDAENMVLAAIAKATGEQP